MLSVQLRPFTADDHRLFSNTRQAKVQSVPMVPPLIAVDFSTLDHLTPRHGQYRYCVSLVRGLARLKPAANFILFGSRGRPAEELRGLIGGEGSRWTYRQLPHHCGMGRYWRDQSTYASILREVRPALYHSLDGFVPLMSCCPRVVTQHDLMVEIFAEYGRVRRSPAYRMNRWAVSHLARRAICSSETTASDLRQLWRVETDRIDVVMLGTEYLADFTESGVENGPETPALAESSQMLLSPYNLEPRKNLTGLLSAVARLHEFYPRLRLVLFGRAAVTSDREQAFERSVAELNLEGVVERTGPLEDLTLQRLYQRCTLFVFPSLYEGFGLPVLEAMACSACVIARSASAMAEVVGDAGMLIETRDPAVLADGIAGLLADARRCGHLRAAASQRATLFTVERMARLMYRSYCVALGIEPAYSSVPVSEPWLRCTG